MVTAADVKSRWNEVQELDEKLLIIVGGPGSGKSKVLRELEQTEGWQYVEAKELLMEKLFEVEHDARTVEAKESFIEAFRSLGDGVIIIDSVEILFAPIFNLKPMELLRELSKQHPVVVGWRGHFDGNTLELEHNSKKNYFSYEITNPKQVLTLD